jgi:two-component system, OmpR family, KDP operon response regulator KdpE
MTPGPSTPLRILLVEDESVNRALFRAVVQRAPEAVVRTAHIIEAGTLADARSLVATETVDIVFLDVRLPDGSGLALAHELRDRSPDQRVTVVIASASVLPSERNAALDAGADVFLAKPYRPQELLDLLIRFVAERDLGSASPPPVG